MIVIADTTPLNHLILIGQDKLLRSLYGRVIIHRPCSGNSKLKLPLLGSRRGCTIVPIGWKSMTLSSLLIQLLRISTLANATRFSWPKTSKQMYC
jgi:hypothetical protein